MARLTPNEIGRTWLANGGAAAHIVVAVAVCIAESGGDTDVVSPSNDYGLWQINKSNFSMLGINSVTARDRDVSARCAIRMSGNGTNWGAWCTCSVRPSDCGHVYRPMPEPGSAAAREIPYVADALNENPPDLGPIPNSSAEGDINYSWAYFQNIVGKFSRDTYNSMQNLNSAVRRL